MVGYEMFEPPKSPMSMTPHLKDGKAFNFDDDNESQNDASSDSGLLNNSDNKSQQAGLHLAKKHKKMWELLGTYIGHDKESIQKQIVNHIEYTGARSRFDFNL